MLMLLIIKPYKSLWVTIFSSITEIGIVSAYAFSTILLWSEPQIERNIQERIDLGFWLTNCILLTLSSVTGHLTLNNLVSISNLILKLKNQK